MVGTVIVGGVTIEPFGGPTSELVAGGTLLIVNGVCDSGGTGTIGFPCPGCGIPADIFAHTHGQLLFATIMRIRKAPASRTHPKVPIFSNESSRTIRANAHT
jgi:hypothetical protein